MRLVNNCIAAEKISPRCEADVLDHAAEAGKGNGEVNIFGCHGLALVAYPRVQLRRHPGFENRQFNGQPILFHKPAAVRPLDNFRWRTCRTVLTLGGGRRIGPRTAACGNQQCSQTGGYQV